MIALVLVGLAGYLLSSVAWQVCKRYGDWPT